METLAGYLQREEDLGSVATDYAKRFCDMICGEVTYYRPYQESDDKTYELNLCKESVDMILDAIQSIQNKAVSDISQGGVDELGLILDDNSHPYDRVCAFRQVTPAGVAYTVIDTRRSSLSLYDMSVYTKVVLRNTSAVPASDILQNEVGAVSE